MSKQSKPEAVPVVFRLFEGEVTALFPSLAAEYLKPYCTCYAHVGQHGAADYGHVISHSRPAKPEEYADLFAELTQVGYELFVVRRRTQAMVQEVRKQQDEWRKL